VTLRHINRRTTCRLCGSSNVAFLFSLTPTPPANAFVLSDQLGVQQDVFPLDICWCEDCTHVQILDIVDPRLLFENYLYVSGTSPNFVRHFEEYSDHICKFVGLPRGALVIDVGSNDGTLLRAFKERHHANILGIDPAANLAADAVAAGIETIADYFTPALATKIADERGKAALITANNVFAHIDDLSSFVEGVRILLAPDGVFVFEVSYLLDVVTKTLFDTIYHEHLSYHSVAPLIPFFENHGLELIEGIRVPTHGGSLRGIVQLCNGPRRHSQSISDLLILEREIGLDQPSTYLKMSGRINSIGEQLNELLGGLRQQGNSIAGFGAPAKSTTLLYRFGLGPQIIDFIVDDSPLKQGKFTPGLHIPVLSARSIADRQPDFLLILAWNFAASIIARHEAFRAKGGRFIVPLPNIEMI
jgi:SAM-dependent methyltransferase